MKISFTSAVSGVALVLACSAGSAQTVISRSVAAEPVETTVTQTPTGTIVTRRPLGEQPAALVEPQVTAPAFAQPTVPAATFVDTGPETVDVFTTRQVVRRAEAERDTRPTVTRQVSAPRADTRRVSTRYSETRRVSTAASKREAIRPSTRASTRVVRPTTREVALRQSAPGLVLNPRERQIIYRTIVDREVIPRQQVIVAPPVLAPAPAVVAPAMRPPVVAADEIVVTDPITVGTVLPENVPLYALPQNVALAVPATQRYSYAWLGGRAYLVDPASGVVVADLSE